MSNDQPLIKTRQVKSHFNREETVNVVQLVAKELGSITRSLYGLKNPDQTTLNKHDQNVPKELLYYMEFLWINLYESAYALEQLIKENQTFLKELSLPSQFDFELDRNLKDVDKKFKDAKQTIIDLNNECERLSKENEMLIHGDDKGEDQ